VNRKLTLYLFLVHVTIIAAASQGLWAAEEPPNERPLPPAANRTISFTNDIRPIFQKACVRCHGPEKQKGDYRLDVRESAFKGGESFAPNILSGKSDSSPLIRFVAGTDHLVMPPEGDRLTSDEIGLLRAWIDQGASWPDDVAGTVQDKNDLWSLKPLVRPGVPSSKHQSDESVKGSLIDDFVQAKRTEMNFRSVGQADRRTLIRRVTFDLIGLPPTADEVDAFIADPDPKAYEALVDRLLKSPRYGERWARHWLDAAHFAETHGNDQDRIREHAWPYRDYLIRSLNDDKPYSRFVEEQIAGDVFFPDDPSATAALGFLAAGPWDESSLRDIREDTIDRQIARYLDRDDMLSNVMNNFCSLTVQCARCHDHKFDPISQRDYYSLQAVFSGVERANRRYDADPEIHLKRTELLRRKRDIEQRSVSEVKRLMSNEIQHEIEVWEQGRASSSIDWHVIDAESFTSSDGATLEKLSDGSILSSGSRPEMDTVTIVSAPLQWTAEDTVNEIHQDQHSRPVEKKQLAFKQITAIRLEVLTHESLPHGGPGRQPDNGNLHLSEFEVYFEGSHQKVELVNPTADFNQQDWEIAKAIDQSEPTAWGIHPKEGLSHQAVFELKKPIQLCSKTAELNDPIQLRFVLKQRHGRGHLIGRTRLSISGAVPPLQIDLIPDPIATILTIPLAQRNGEQRLELAIFQQLNEVSRSLSSLPGQNLVYAAAADFDPDGSLRPPPGPRAIHILHRGDIRQPKEEVASGALACVATVRSQFEIPAIAPESARRAALARWLTNKDNPLTWRSIVNRVWHHHFGRGLVRTLNDFGNMGEKPTHPELLDWLAVEFRDGDQSLKRLHRLIVTSQAYQQKVQNPTYEKGESLDDHAKQDLRLSIDSDNHFLWRMNRTRLDAESIRDAILAISDRMDLRMGGPSDRQFDLQPGIHVTPRVDYSKFDPSADAGRRRSIYRFLFRTLPDPLMESLDCPSGDQITPARTNDVTIQQALSLWNDKFICQHCEHLAVRIERDVVREIANSSDPALLIKPRINQAFRLILGRHPTDTESVDAIAYADRHGLANFCRLLLNSNEFLFVN
jgi:mono/diheme cytochrome c family protein